VRIGVIRPRGECMIPVLEHIPMKRNCPLAPFLGGIVDNCRTVDARSVHFLSNVSFFDNRGKTHVSL